MAIAFVRAQGYGSAGNSGSFDCTGANYLMVATGNEENSSMMETN